MSVDGVGYNWNCPSACVYIIGVPVVSYCAARLSAIDSLVTGMGRQSKLMLDNLRIMVDTNKSYKDFAKANNIAVSAMTDVERKQAFVNAAMKEANFLVAELGEDQLTTKDAIAQATTAVGDLGIKIGDMLAPHVIKVAEALTAFVEGTEAFLDWADGVDTSTESLERLDFEAARSQEVFEGLQKGMGKTDTEAVSLIQNMFNMREELEEIIRLESADNIFLKLFDGIGPTRTRLENLNFQIERYMEDIRIAAENSEPMIVSQLRQTDLVGEYISQLEKLPEAQNSVSEAQQRAISDSIKLEVQRKSEA